MAVLDKDMPSLRGRLSYEGSVYDADVQEDLCDLYSCGITRLWRNSRRVLDAAR